MAGKVFFSVSMSLDGFIAPDSPEELMGKQWMELQKWAFRQRFFRENLGIGEGGEEGLDNDIARAITVRWPSVRSGWAAKSRSSSRRSTASAWSPSWRSNAPAWRR